MDPWVGWLHAFRATFPAQGIWLGWKPQGEGSRRRRCAHGASPVFTRLASRSSPSTLGKSICLPSYSQRRPLQDTSRALPGARAFIAGLLAKSPPPGPRQELTSTLGEHINISVNRPSPLPRKSDPSCIRLPLNEGEILGAEGQSSQGALGHQ